MVEYPPVPFSLVVASLVASLWCRWLRASCMPGAEDFRAEASIVRIKTPTLWQITGHRQQAHRPSKATRNRPALKRATTCNNAHPPALPQTLPRRSGSLDTLAPQQTRLPNSPRDEIFNLRQRSQTPPRAKQRPTRPDLTPLDLSRTGIHTRLAAPALPKKHALKVPRVNAAVRLTQHNQPALAKPR